MATALLCAGLVATACGDKPRPVATAVRAVAYSPPDFDPHPITTTTTQPPKPVVAVTHRRALPPRAPVGSTVPTADATLGQSALASFYAYGSRTASGERFDPDGLTFAHKSMRFGTMVRFSANGRSVVARCNDRGPFVGGRSFDLSRGAFVALAPISAGVIRVSWEVV